MKENLKNKLMHIGLIFLLMLAVSCRQKDNHKHAEGQQYTCPMHPQIVKNEPGSCPICGMDLVKKGGVESNDTILQELARLLKPTTRNVISTIGTINPQKKEMSVALQSQGIISYDTRRIYNIAARFGGRIEKLYVKYNFQEVKKGQKLFEVYSPQIATAQRELIYLIENDRENSALIGAAKQKLSLLGLSGSQIQQVEQRKKADYSLTVYSPYNGYVIEDAALASVPTLTTSTGSGQGAMGGMSPPASAPDPSMNAQTTSNSASAQFSIREGMYINVGQSVFKVVNTDVVWAVFSAYPEDIARIHKNQQINIALENDSNRILHGRVDFVEPFYGESSALPAFRVYLPNSEGKLRVGNLLRGTIQVEKQEALWLPIKAVLDLGARQIAFLKDKQVFTPIVVTTGQRAGGWVEIKGGLQEKDVVAKDAQFMIDSESFIKVKEDAQLN